MPTNYLEEEASASHAAAGTLPEEPSGPESTAAAGAAGVASSSAALGSRTLLDGGGVSRARSAARAFPKIIWTRWRTVPVKYAITRGPPVVAVAVSLDPILPQR